MIALDRLQQIIPADQALANKALATALQQITGISTLTLPALAQVTRALQTTRDLPTITALTQAVPPAVADYYANNLAQGGGVNGDIRIVDILGSAGGWVSTDAFLRTVELFAQMDLSELTLIYNTMVNALDGTYGDTEAGPLTIPGGLPGAGTYNGTEIDPGPPPEYDPSAIELAMIALTSAADAEIANLESTYPQQTSELNTLWTSMCEQITLENTLQSEINLNFSTLTANDRNSIYGFVFNLSNYGTQTEQGGVTQLIENMADLTTQGGQAIVACLRQGRNQEALGQSGIYTNSNIPAEPVPPPPQAELLPSEYSESEASDLVIK